MEGAWEQGMHTVKYLEAVHEFKKYSEFTSTFLVWQGDLLLISLDKDPKPSWAGQ